MKRYTTPKIRFVTTMDATILAGSITYGGSNQGKYLEPESLDAEFDVEANE